jgi:hypothetical protein
MSTYRTDAGLTYADFDETDWHAFANETIQRISAFLGRLAVDFAEFPSASLNVKVSAGTYEAPDGQRVSYAGTASVACTANQANRLYLDASGALVVTTSSWPSGEHLRLAEVVAGASTIASIADRREPLRRFGAGAGAYLQLSGGTLSGDLTLATGVDLVLATSGAGTAIGTGATQLLGFHGATPTAQAASADQGALTDSTGGSTAGFILAAALATSSIADSSGGTASTTIASLAPPAALTGGAGGTADGAIQSVGGSYSQAEVANNFDELTARVNQLIALAASQRNAIATLAAAVNDLVAVAEAGNDNDARLARLANATRAALVTKGLIKGSA